MKKVFFIALLAIFGVTTTQAQEVRLGAKGGVNFASIRGDNTETADGRTSFHIGGFVEIPISERFSVQPEVLYSSQGWKIDQRLGNNGSVKLKADSKLDYINVPVLAKFYVIKGLSLEAGPQIGFLTSATTDVKISGDGASDYEIESGETDFKDQASNIDFGIGAGASYRFTNGISFSARYVLGLSNIDEVMVIGDAESGGGKHNNVVQLSIGYSF